MTRKNERMLGKGLLALGLILGAGATSSQAQPGFGGPGGFGRGGQEEADYRQLTPEQQEVLTEQVRDFAREQLVRLMLSNAGFADKAVQDAVVAFSNEQSKAMAKLNDQSIKVRMGLREQNAPANQLSTLLNDLNAATEAENTRRKTALEALNAKINFRNQPRLEAVLTTMGLVGDEMAVAGLGSGFAGRGFGGGAFGGGFGGGGFGGGGFGGGGFGAREGDGGDRGGRGFGGRGDRGGRGERDGDQGAARGGREGGNREGGRGGRGNRERGNREGGANREAA